MPQTPQKHRSFGRFDDIIITRLRYLFPKVSKKALYFDLLCTCPYCIVASHSSVGQFLDSIIHQS